MATPRDAVRHPLARRVGRAVLAVALVALGLAVVAAGIGYGWLTSPPGEDWLRGKMLQGLSGKISGKLEIARLRVHGLRWDAEGVSLTAPSGEVVGRATAIADLDLLALARGRLQLSDARVSGLVLAVDLTRAGVPLLQAVIPPSAASGGARSGGSGQGGSGKQGAGGGGGSSGFALRRVRLSNTRVVVRQARAPALARTFAVGPFDGVLLHGAGWELTVAGGITAPLAGPLRATASTVSAGGVRSWRLDLAAPGLSVSGGATLQGPRRSARIDRVAVEPAAARAIWPADPVPVPLAGSAVLTSPGGATWTFDAEAASGAVRVRAGGTLSPAGVEVPRLLATLPGATATGTLAVSGGRTRGALAVRAPDLGAAARAVSAATGVPLPLAGAGALRIAVASPGPGAAPALRFSGRFPTLSTGPATAAGVRLAGSAQAGTPGEVRLDLSAREATLAGRVAGPVGAALTAGGRRFAAAVDARRRPFLRARGRLAPAGRGPRAAVLELLSLPGWRLVHPARLVAGRAGAASVQGLVLGGRAGRVSLDGTLSHGVLRATIGLAGVRLAALSAALPLPRLAGIARGAISISGAAANPTVSARLDVRGGPLPGVRTARLEVARGPGGPLRARVAVAAPGATAQAWVATSDGFLRAPRTTPVRAALRARGAAAALARLGAGAAGDASLARRVAAAGLRGRAWLAARAEGTLAAPNVRADVAARGVSAHGSPRADLRAVVSHRPGGTVARVALRSRRGGRLSLDADVEAPAGPGGPARLRARLAARALDAGTLAPWIPGVVRAGGRIDANAWAEGPLFAPRAGGRLSWRGGRVVTDAYGRLDGVTLLAQAGPAGWRIDRLDARSGGGRIAASARGASAGAVTRVEAHARLASFPVVWGSRLRARVSGRVSLSGAVGATSRLLAEVSAAEVVLPPRLGAQVTPLHRPSDVRLVTAVPPIAAWGPPARPAPAPAPPRRVSSPARPPITVALATPTPLRIRGQGVDARIVAAPGLRLVRAGRWLLYGALRIPSGSVDLLGEQVALLDRSEIRFAGPPDVPFIAVGARGTAGATEGTLVFSGAPGALQVGVAPPGTSIPGAFASLAGAASTRPALHPPTPGSAPLALLDAQAPLAVLLGRGGAATSFAAGTPLTGRIRIEAAERIAADRWRGENRHVTRLDLALEGALDASLTTGDAGSLGVGLSWTTTRP